MFGSVGCLVDEFAWWVVLFVWWFVCGSVVFGVFVCVFFWVVLGVCGLFCVLRFEFVRWVAEVGRFFWVFSTISYNF